MNQKIVYLIIIFCLFLIHQDINAQDEEEKIFIAVVGGTSFGNPETFGKAGRRCLSSRSWCLPLLNNRALPVQSVSRHRQQDSVARPQLPRCVQMAQVDDVVAADDVGYLFDFYVGHDAQTFLKSIWPDFKTDSIGVAIHEKISGYAETAQMVRGLAEKCR